MFGLPADGDAVPTRLVVVRDATAATGDEIWNRTFAGRDLVTRQRAIGAGLLAERLGCVELMLRVAVEGRALLFTPIATRLFLGPVGLPLPSWLEPRVQARATARADGIHLRVSVGAALTGRLLEYEGLLEAER